MRLFFFEIFRRSICPTGSVALSKHDIKYGTQSGFPYYNMTIPTSKVPYLLFGDVLSNFVGFSLVNRHQYPVWHICTILGIYQIITVISSPVLVSYKLPIQSQFRVAPVVTCTVIDVSNLPGTSCFLRYPSFYTCIYIYIYISLFS